MTLVEFETVAVAVESAKNSQEVMTSELSAATRSTYRKQQTEDTERKCWGCGSTKHFR